ncbi:MAG: helix-turn-helix domain-containing protein [Gammaproteobacteria bacterium]|nr:helix-turn-helix domain-containing protein [Gammaproteobacteria bacterium]
MNERKKPIIALLAAPETSASVLYGLYDILLSVGAVYLDMVTGSPGDELLDVRIVSAEGKPFHCIGNIPVIPHHSIDEIETVDAVVICDMYTSIYDVPKGRYPREVSWLKQMHSRGTLLSSVCSGTLLLAESGLLNGHQATSHWAYRDMFQRHFPAITFRNESVLCLNAESDRIVTAGGVSAWHDLAIYLIAQYCGYKAAIETAKVFLINGHYEGQSPYSVMTRPMESNDGPVSGCLDWIAENYATDNPVEAMVGRSGLKPRTFSRRFRAVTGVSPIEYVQALRVEEAKQMLEQDEVSNDAVGVEIGYDDPVSFRRVFKRYCGLTPAAYRKKFQRISRIAQPAKGG